MRKTNRQEKAGYRVLCAWCGGTIRQSIGKDAEGMCSACHARMLREHFRAQSADTFENASER
jgi:hypothetical protein